MEPKCLGLGSASALDRPADRLSGRTALLQDQLTARRSAVVGKRSARPAACLAVAAGVRRRFAPHQLRHAHAVEMAREGVPLNVIQRQLGHANLGVTSIYLQGIEAPRSSGGTPAGADARRRRVGAVALFVQADLSRAG